MSGLVVCGLATGLQIGMVYFILVWIGMLVATVVLREKFPVGPMVALLVIPLSLVGLVVFGFPRLWAGFMEHATQTPSLTGWRLPRIDELLKAGRTVPGILTAAVLLAWLTVVRGRPKTRPPPPRGPLEPAVAGFMGSDTGSKSSGRVGLRSRASPHDGVAGSAASMLPAMRDETLWLVTTACTGASAVIILASMVLLTPNSVFFAAHLQPLAVAGCLAIAGASLDVAKWRPRLAWIFAAMAALGSIRAVGLTTWGLACAHDCGYSATIQRLRSELAGCAPGKAVVLSSGYLYEAARDNRINWIHSDWMEKAERGQPPKDWEGLLSLKPAKLILTQFDYYRRFEPLLVRLKARPDIASVRIVNAARRPPPDASRTLRRVVQHISWAPVVVTFAWDSAEERDSR